MNLYLAIALAAVLAALVTFLITFISMKGKENRIENQHIAAKEELRSAEKLQQMQQESFQKQLEAVRGQLTAETEKLLKQREDALQKKAEETFTSITGSLNKDIKAMQEAFDAQKRTQTEGNATLKTVVEQAV